MSALLNHAINPATLTIIAPQERYRNVSRQVRCIQSTVAEAFGLAGREVLLKQCREHRFRDARAVAYYLCRKLTPCSWPELGRAFGGRDQRLDICPFVISQVARISQVIAVVPPSVLVRPHQLPPLFGLPLWNHN